MKSGAGTVPARAGVVGQRGRLGVAGQEPRSATSTVTRPPAAKEDHDAHRADGRLEPADDLTRHAPRRSSATPWMIQIVNAARAPASTTARRWDTRTRATAPCPPRAPRRTRRPSSRRARATVDERAAAGLREVTAGGERAADDRGDHPRALDDSPNTLCRRAPRRPGCTNVGYRGPMPSPRRGSCRRRTRRST